MQPTTGPTREPRPVAGLDRDVLVGNLVSGALWLIVLATTVSRQLSELGAVYVVAMSLLMARVYARTRVTARWEVLAWVTPWLVAVALWAWVVTTGVEDGTSAPLAALWFGLLLGTACYVAWQVTALAVRQFLRWTDSDPVRR